MSKRSLNYSYWRWLWNPVVESASVLRRKGLVLKRKHRIGQWANACWRSCRSIIGVHDAHVSNQHALIMCKTALKSCKMQSSGHCWTSGGASHSTALQEVLKFVERRQLAAPVIINIPQSSLSHTRTPRWNPRARSNYRSLLSWLLLHRTHLTHCSSGLNVFSSRYAFFVRRLEIPTHANLSTLTRSRIHVQETNKFKYVLFFIIPLWTIHHIDNEDSLFCALPALS